MGRNAARELNRIVETIAGYLERAECDPSLPLTYEGVQKHTGVSRGHLSRRTEPEILEIVARIAKIKAARTAHASEGGRTQPALPVTTVDGGTTAHTRLTDDALEAVIRRELGEVTRLQQMWLGHHGKGASSVDAALALYDADLLLGRLRAAVERLRPAVGEWNRRRGLLLQSQNAGKQTENHQPDLVQMR